MSKKIYAMSKRGAYVMIFPKGSKIFLKWG